ncbi:hypothetical protein K3495_g2286 [Podosphaera aphanis]|nr:hypothetical protein K3495_g2286 [Podosphaera aphanis]
MHMNNDMMDHDMMDHDMMGHNHMSHDMPGHDHAHMGHSMPASCNMNMLFTWNTSNLCIIFEWWRVRGPLTLVFSLLGVIAVTALFEALRAGSRRFEQRAKLKKDIEPRQRLFGRRRRTHFLKAILYAIQSFYGLMLMLIFMTYNGWVMLSMGVGAFLGYLIFGEDTSATKDGACH